MTRDDIVEYCLAKPGAYLDSPWGEEDTVVKVGGKIFCFLGGADAAVGICVKNTRELIIEWRTRYPEHATVARYLNKGLWNQVSLEGAGAPDLEDAHELIDDSYDLIVAALPTSKRPS